MALWPDTQEWYRGVATKIYKQHHEWAARATNEFYFDVEFDDGDVRREIPDHEIISLKFYKLNSGEEDDDEEEDKELEGADREEEGEGKPSSVPGTTSRTKANKGSTGNNEGNGKKDEERDREDEADEKPSSVTEATNTTLTNRGTTTNNEFSLVIQPISEPPGKAVAIATSIRHEAMESPKRRPTPPTVTTPLSPQCIEYKI